MRLVTGGPPGAVIIIGFGILIYYHDDKELLGCLGPGLPWPGTRRFAFGTAWRWA